jgi:hypothetical protein
VFFEIGPSFDGHPRTTGFIMGRRPHHQSKRQKTRSSAPPPPAIRVPEPKAVVHYGKPFIVLEDGQKQTFVFASGKWQPHSSSIAECRVDCQVKQLPQKINGMTRYEVCEPI